MKNTQSRQNGFNQSKKEILKNLKLAIDKSPKGNVDLPIRTFIHRINEHVDYVTTSSCSGRISVFQHPNDSDENKGGKWIIASHDVVTPDQLLSVLTPSLIRETKKLIFKHEPFIMHVQCRDLDAAKALLQVGLAKGFRESGIVLGQKKIMVAIRTTANSLELPLILHNELLLSRAYLQVLVTDANEKFIENSKRTRALEKHFEQTFFPSSAAAVEDMTTSRLDMKATWNVRKDSLGHSRLTFRYGHSAIHYQSSVILFGGFGANDQGMETRLNDLVEIQMDEPFQVNPIVPTSLATDAPAPRMHHTACRFQDQMLVFGGRGSPVSGFDDLFSFHLPTREWRQIITTSGSPSARWNHTAVIVDDNMYIHGGRDAQHVFYDLVCYSISRQEWTVVDLTLPSVFGHVMISRGSLLLIYGGLGSIEAQDDISPDVIEVNLTTEEVTRVDVSSSSSSPVPNGRFAHASVVLENRYWMITGGMHATSAMTRAADLSCYVLDLETLEWTSFSTEGNDNPHVMFLYHTLAVLPNTNTSNGDVISVGGGTQCFGFGTKFSHVAQVSYTLPVPNVLLSNPRPKNLPKEQQQRWIAEIEPTQVKTIKTMLEQMQVYDKSRRIRPLAKSTKYAVPFVTNAVPSSFLESTIHYRLDEEVQMSNTGTNPKLKNPNARIHAAIQALVNDDDQLPASLLANLPDKYERIADVILIPADAFVEPAWEHTNVWHVMVTAAGHDCTRVARKSRIRSNLKRQSQVQILYPKDVGSGWVRVKENGITYSFDLTRVMFSKGNGTEKARMGVIAAKEQKKRETVVDMYAGIGYYVLPFLVHGQAAKVYALEWNPDSIEALRLNLTQNQIEAHRYEVLPGDNRLTGQTIGPVADRVNLGLLPCSESSWEIAIQLIKRDTGGWIHVHGNVGETEREVWINRILSEFARFAQIHDIHFTYVCGHLEVVKSYAPRIHHLVADIQCIPVL